MNMLEFGGLNQINHISNGNGRTLDLALSNIQNVRIYETQALSTPDIHHPPLCAIISNLDIKFLKTIKTPKINFHKLDYNGLCLEMDGINWNELLAPHETDEAIDIFYGKIIGLITKFSKVTIPTDCKYPKWFNNITIQLLKEKEGYRDLFRRTGQNVFNELYKIKRRLFKKEKERCEKNYINNIEDNILPV